MGDKAALTRDLGGGGSTTSLGQAIVQALASAQA